MTLPARRAVVRCASCTAYEHEDLSRAIEDLLTGLGDLGLLGRRGEHVLLKPNLLKASPAAAAVVTHPALIEAVLARIIDAGARPVIADSPAYGTIEQVAAACGLDKVAAHFGVPIQRFDQPRSAFGGSAVFSELVLDRLALEADRIVNLPKLKAHRQLYFTGAVKNLFGCVPGRRKAWWHVKAGAYEQYFARMLVDTAAILAPAISLLDGVVGMEGEGPAKGSPRHVGVLVASRDPVALDRVAVELIGADPERVPTLAVAREMGVGVPDLEAIDLGEVSLEALRVNPPFRMPDLRPIGFSLPRLVRGGVRQAWLERGAL